MKHEGYKYIVVFLITVGIFAIVFYLTGTLNKKRINEIRSIQDSISIDILSLEIRFSLLEESSCEYIVPGDPILSEELNELGKRLEFTESQLGSNNESFIQLKKYYSLLQIKDYLLTKKFA